MNAWEGCIIATIELLDPGGSETAGPNSILIYREVARRLPEFPANSVYLGNARNRAVSGEILAFVAGTEFWRGTAHCRLRPCSSTFRRRADRPPAVPQVQPPLGRGPDHIAGLVE